MDKILRHFEVLDLEAIGNGADYGEYEAFVYGHHGVYDATVEQLANDGKKFIRYINVLTRPVPEWHDEWFDWVRTNWPRIEGAVFPWFGRPELIDWALIGPALAQQAIDKLVELRIGKSGFFLDMFWIRPRPWMFHPDYHQYEDYDPWRWYDYERNLMYFLKHLRKRYVIRKDKAIILTNGQERSDLDPFFIEHAEWDWDTALYHFHGTDHPDTVLSVNAADISAVDTAIENWTGSGKWISFTGPEAYEQLTMQAYAHAALARS